MSTITVALPCGRTFKIDAADVHLLDGRHWYSAKRGRTFYVRGDVFNRNGGRVYLHTLIMGGRSDHRDGDGLNNTRSNLRHCTQAQNCCNKSPKAGKRFKGVFFDKRRGTFYSQVVLHRKAHSSPSFTDEIEAARWHDAKAIELHGEFARLNFPSGAAA